MALGFAAWGLISAFASTFRTQFHLSAQATAFLVAVPVLLGSLARLPIGMLTDRFGGRAGVQPSVPVRRGRGMRSFRSAATYERLARLWLPPRDRGRFVRRRRGLLVPMVSTGSAGHRARHLRTRQHGTLGGRVPRSGHRCLLRTRYRLLHGRRPVGRVGNRVLHARTQCSRDCEAGVDRRDGRGPREGATLLGALRVLFPHLRRLRRILRLPAHPLAR